MSNEFSTFLETLQGVELSEEQKLRALSLSIAAQTFYVHQGYTGGAYTTREPQDFWIPLDELYARAEEIMKWIKSE